MDILLSLRPKWAALVRSGAKTAELRKRPLPADAGRVYVYETAPAGSVCGWFRIERIEVLPLEALWAASAERSCVPRDEFDAYYAGAEKGAAIFFSGFHAMKPVPLSRLMPRPPQSWMRLSEAQSALLENAAAEEAACQDGREKSL